MIEIGKGGRREIDVTLLSRYACYLVIQNADPTKKIVAAEANLLRHPDAAAGIGGRAYRGRAAGFVARRDAPS